MIRRGNYDMIDYESSKITTTRQDYFLKKCSELAHHSNLTHKHGCIIVKKNQIVSSGFNFKVDNTYRKRESSLCFVSRDHNSSCFSIHAEVSTLKKVKNIDLSKCEMYVVRIGSYSSKNKGAGLRYSHPCDACAKAIIHSGLRKVYYSINDICQSEPPVINQSQV